MDVPQTYDSRQATSSATAVKQSAVDRVRRVSPIPVSPTLPWPDPSHPTAARVKRAFDVVAALVLLVIMAVPMLLILVLVKLTSRGPALYVQQRVGLRGKKFAICKFRTMRVDAEAATGPVWAVVNDPRETPIGGLLRRLGLDELPQLLNVLRGEMSLVGPRPERPCFVEQLSQALPDYTLRHSVPPGITGWAQVNGWRGATSIRRRLECDLHYTQCWSLWLDLYILALTPLEIIRGNFTNHKCET